MGWTVYCALLIIGVTLTAEGAPTQLEDTTGADEPLVVCYFSSWARYRPGDGMFDVDNIDASLCTHLVFGFTGLSNWTWTIQVLDPWNELCADDPWAAGEGNYCAFNRFNALRNQNPNVKTTVAIGGWNEGSSDYSIMARDPLKRKTFVESVMELVERYDFDGFDFDWEYPAARGGIPEDKENFILVLDMLRYELDQFTPKKILTSALAAGKPTIDPAYDIPGIVRNFDIFHIMAYDYHGAFEPFTHHNAPLCKYYQDDALNATTFNVEFTINYYIELGLPAERMTMGIATYGRCYILDDINDHGMIAPASKAGTPGPYTRMPGSLGFNEVCERFVGDQSDDTCTIVHDPALHEPYFYCTSDNIWCGYDDAESIELKAKFARNKGLGGVIVWTIDTDDFLPKCYDETYHLIRSARKAWQAPVDPDYEACIPYNPDGSTTAESTTASPTTASPTTAEVTTEGVTTADATTADATTASATTAEATTASATTAETTTASPTTASPTTASPSTASPTTTKPGPSTSEGPCVPGLGDKPNCKIEPEGSMFAHYDCNKYWECEHGGPILNLCPPGTMYDAIHGFCNWQDQVDTTCCRQWDCSIDNTYFPAEDCDKYYRCYNGEPHLEQCLDCLFWNQGIFQCTTPISVDTSSCSIPDYC